MNDSEKEDRSLEKEFRSLQEDVGLLDEKIMFLFKRIREISEKLDYSFQVLRIPIPSYSQPVSPPKGQINTPRTTLPSQPVKTLPSSTFVKTSAISSTQKPQTSAISVPSEPLETSNVE